jgi:hypothetical protein
MIKQESTKVTPESLPANLKEKRAAFSFRITIRDRDHFYKIIHWLNKNVGKGEEKWTMEGRILKSIKSGKPVSPMIYIFKEDFEEDSSLYLSLL